MISISQVEEYLKTNGDFNVYGQQRNELVFNGVNAVNTLKLWDWIKYVDPNKGFVCSKSKHTAEIWNELSTDDHSAVTFAVLLRLLQNISQKYIKDEDEFFICTICYEEKDHVSLKTILDCGHTFHSKCIRIWQGTVLAKGCCPNCKDKTLPEYN